jgi:hypothetical protein
MLRPASLTLLAALCGLATSAHAQTNVAPPATPASTAFTRRVLENFDAWDLDKDGALSVAEIDKLVGDLRVNREAAAALGSLKLTLRKSSSKPPVFDRAYFLRYAERYHNGKSAAEPEPQPETGDSTPISDSTEEEEAEKKEGFPRYDSYYGRALRRIKSAPRVLFTKGAPRLSDMQQGQIGDCFLISMLGCLLNRDPARFRGMFSLQPDGSCTVYFPNGRAVNVHNLTDAEVALSSGTSGTGRWLAVLEEAYGHLNNNVRSEEKQKEVVTDLISHGGNLGLCIRTLTGHVSQGTWFRKKVKGEWKAPTPAYVASRLPGLRERLTKSLNAGLLIGGSVERYSRPPGITGNHAYAILGYDAASDTVRVWNPHGNTFTPRGTPGLKYGYRTRSGTFTMLLAEFVQVFAHMDFETNEPLKRKKPAS